MRTADTVGKKGFRFLPRFVRHREAISETGASFSRRSLSDSDWQRQIDLGVGTGASHEREIRRSFFMLAISPGILSEFEGYISI